MTFPSHLRRFHDCRRFGCPSSVEGAMFRSAHRPVPRVPRGRVSWLDLAQGEPETTPHYGRKASADVDASYSRDARVTVGALIGPSCPRDWTIGHPGCQPERSGKSGYVKLGRSCTLASLATKHHFRFTSHVEVAAASLSASAAQRSPSSTDCRAFFSAPSSLSMRGRKKASTARTRSSVHMAAAT